MSDDQLNAEIERYLNAAAMNSEPPPIGSDELVGGGSPIEQLLRALGLAANEDDPIDNAESLDGYAERDARTTEAATTFAAQDQQAAAQMAQQIPQLVSGIAGALAGALGGALAPLAQIPQQALQAGMGIAQQVGGATVLDDGPAAGDFGDPGPDPAADIGGLDDPLGSLGGGLASADGFDGGPAAAIPATAPTATLGPPAVPSAATAPSSAPALPPTHASITPAAAPSGPGMSGVPMIPPGAAAGGTGPERDAKSDTRRVSAPAVRNGAPVQGRLSAPPSAPTVTRTVAGNPVATRRIVAPDEPEQS